MSSTTKAKAPSVEISCIGVVESPFLSPDGGYDYGSEARVVIDPQMADGLTGIEYFSHIWVIYHQHRSHEWLRCRDWGERASLVLPPEDDRAGQGVFSSRAPCRPARLGSCIVELVRREGNVLFVRGLDALHGTPVLDVKPYVPHFDAFPAAVVPLHWARVMDREGDRTRLSRELHWDTSAPDFVHGMRAGTAVMKRFGLKERGRFSCSLLSSPVFALGFELITGASPLRGTLCLQEAGAGCGAWTVSATLEGFSVVLCTQRLSHLDTQAILTAPESELFTFSNP